MPQFPTGWGRRCELKIQASKVSANLSNFPVLLTKDTLPSEMFDADGPYPALAGGGDIRFSADITGITRLACEIVTFTIDNDPANGVAQIWVNVASISSSVDTSIWVWYDKSGESQPARAAAYGTEATWDSDFVGVWHLDETSGNAIDSTFHVTDGTLSGGVTRQASGPFSECYSFDGIDGQVDMGDPVDGHLDFGTGPLTMELWSNTTATTGTYQRILYKGATDAGDPGYVIRSNLTGTSFWPMLADGADEQPANSIPSTFGVWMHIVAVVDRSDNTFRSYKDGSLFGSPNDISHIGNIDSVQSFKLSRSAQPFEGKVDEARISDIARTADWISSSYNNQYDPPTFVIEQTPESTFPEAWGRKCELKIQASKVATNLSNFPVLLTEDTLPSEMFDADGLYPALAGGGDIRFTSDEAGTTRLACEIVTFAIDNDPANGVGQIWVNVASISSVTDTSIWVWYNKAGESQPARAAAYGMEATWNSSFVGVWHLDETSGNAIDSTSHTTDGTLSGGVTREATGPVGKGYSFDGVDGQVSMGDPVDGHLDFGTGSFTAGFWVVVSGTTGDYQMPLWKGGSATVRPGYCWVSSGPPSGFYPNVNDVEQDKVSMAPGFPLTWDVWMHSVVVRDAGADLFRGYKDGVPITPATDISIVDDIDTTDDFLLSRVSRPLYGMIDEVRMSDVIRSAGWISSSYNNQYDPATFVIEQTPQSLYERKLEGITYDKTGSILGSCECYLFKDNLDNTLTYVAYTLSDAGTGAYSFTGIYDESAQYIVVAWKDDTPHIFDVTDHVLLPVAV